MHACVFVCIYFIRHYICYFLLDCLFLSVFKVIQLMLRAMSDVYFRKLK